MKTCSKCKKEKPLTEFHKYRKRGESYYNVPCKNCMAENYNQFRIRNPWLNNYQGAKKRCENIKSKKYPRYGGRGIKFLMTMEDFKTLWFRDKAHLLKKPSIDRKNNDGNYELSNCRFIELSENSRLGGKLKKGATK